MHKPASRWPLALLVFLLWSAAHDGAAGILEIVGNAATVGDAGLQVTAGVTCVQDDVVVPGPSVNSDQLACNTVTAGNVQVISPGASFTAGTSIRLLPGFSVASGAPFNAGVDPFVATAFAFVQDDNPNAETTYNARFDLRLDSLNIAVNEDIGHLNGYSADAILQFQVVLRRVAGQNRLALLARDDVAGAMVEHFTDFQLDAGTNAVQIKWVAGAGNGQFLVSINGLSMQGLTTLNNASSSIDFVRWGLVDGNLSLTAGFIELDDFFSWR